MGPVAYSTVTPRGRSSFFTLCVANVNSEISCLETEIIGAINMSRLADATRHTLRRYVFKDEVDSES